MTIYDITRTITPETATFPGDTPFSYEQKLKLSEGASVNLFTLTSTAHIGTHMDGTYHYNDEGLHPAEMPLERFIGPARVVTVSRETGPITPEDLGDVEMGGVERLLLHTVTSSVPDTVFSKTYPHPSVELVDWMAVQGVKLIGVDAPSVDPPTSKTLDTHHRLDHHDIYIIENLMLNDVPDGVYELIALPLKIDDVCGSPVRAILRTL